MIFRQLLDLPTSTFTYLLGDPVSRDAVLIDSVFEQHARELALVRELGLNLKFTLETHVHADHVTGAWLLKNAIGSEICVGKSSGAQGADRFLVDGETIRIGEINLEVRATPGHTAGCVSYYCEKMASVFTGDALLIRGAGRTDFQEGSAQSLFRSVRERLFTLPDETAVYPGHDYSGRTSTTILEEKAFNPRLGDKVREADFVEYMKNLGLPHPKRLDIAVPANLRCGKPEERGGDEANEAWAPVVRTYAGVLQVEPEWVATHRGDVLVLEVRETAELESSSLGTIAGALRVPLSQLREEVSTVPKDKPVVTVCPAGARSAMAAMILEQAGIRRVANLRGGVIEWQAQGYPTEREPSTQAASS